MRVLVAPLEFKGTLTAVQAAQAIARGVRAARPDVEVDLAPMADGGPGTVSAMVHSRSGELHTVTVADALGRDVQAQFGSIDNRHVAIVEMAAASGLSLLGESERSVLDASTYGTGQLIRAALQIAQRELIIGAGGSATNDGGQGAAMALGVRFLDSAGRPLPRGPRSLERLAKLDLEGVDAKLTGVKLTVATDVTNPLLGPSGATRVFGPQKGATGDELGQLERGLSRLADVILEQLGVDVANAPGAGAAGGLAYGLVALFGARIVRGFEVVCDALDVGVRLERADVLITGEGRVDAQTAMGKGPGELAALAKQEGKRAVAFAGVVDASFSDAQCVFDELVSLSAITSPERARACAAKVLEEAARSWAKRAL